MGKPFLGVYRTTHTDEVDRATANSSTNISIDNLPDGWTLLGVIQNGQGGVAVVGVDDHNVLEQEDW